MDEHESVGVVNTDGGQSESFCAVAQFIVAPCRDLASLHQAGDVVEAVPGTAGNSVAASATATVSASCLARQHCT